MQVGQKLDVHPPIVQEACFGNGCRRGSGRERTKKGRSKSKMLAHAGLQLNYAFCAWVSAYFWLATPGKTLNLDSSQFFATGWRQDMYTLLSQVFRFLPFARAVAPVHGVAHNLMERAQARAGRNPQQAESSAANRPQRSIFHRLFIP
ncbi:hypothetical protein [Polaromonas sp. AER18D-145]|uniref:hypothetical protein n=1 Tax=Polaromonas sp. AER18D-145 TaxID=1977060 RepID=UPI0011443E54|nr:hypothetical protein [Polaromonas sp. AER18D-145]